MLYAWEQTRSNSLKRNLSVDRCFHKKQSHPPSRGRNSVQRRALSGVFNSLNTVEEPARAEAGAKAEAEAEAAAGEGVEDMVGARAGAAIEERWV